MRPFLENGKHDIKYKCLICFKLLFDDVTLIYYSINCVEMSYIVGSICIT